MRASFCGRVLHLWTYWFGFRRLVRNGIFAGGGRPIPHFIETEATLFSYRKYAGFGRSGTKVTGQTTLVIALWTLTLVPSSGRICNKWQGN
jgi:hypothetical protein